MFAVMSFDVFCGFMGLSLAVLFICVKKFADSNPDVKDAAKKAASSKAIDLIQKWLK